MSAWIDVVAATVVGALVALALWNVADALGRIRKAGGAHALVLGLAVGAAAMVAVSSLAGRTREAVQREDLPAAPEWNYSGSERSPEFDSARGWRKTR